MARRTQDSFVSPKPKRCARPVSAIAAALRNWVHEAEVDGGRTQGAPDALTSAEKTELGTASRDQEAAPGAAGAGGQCGRRHRRARAECAL